MLGPSVVDTESYDPWLGFLRRIRGRGVRGRLPLDNNLAERGIKPFVIGRKNFLFSDTPRSAEASAGMYSIVVTAKANGLNPRKYEQWLLDEMPNAADPGDPGDPVFLDSLMPWSESVLAEMRPKPKAAEMSDDPIIDIDPSAFRDDEEKNRNLSEFSQSKLENSERLIVLRVFYDVHRLL